MPITVGARFTLDYNLSENVRLVRDLNYTIVEMTDDTFSVEAFDENGDPVEPCVELLRSGDAIAKKEGFAQIKIQTNDIKDVDATINISVTPQIESIEINIDEFTLLV